MITLWQCRKCLVVYVSHRGVCPKCNEDPITNLSSGPRRVCEIPDRHDIAGAKEAS